MIDFFKFLNDNSSSAVLFIGMAVSILILVVWQLDKSIFNLKDLIVDSVTGKTSLYKIGQLIALLVSTWVLVHETQTGRISEWLFSAYMLAWAGANSLNKFISLKTKPDADIAQK